MLLDSIRRKRLVDGLIAAGLDAVICSAPSDVLLLTGYWPVMAMSVAVVTASGECHVLLPDDEAELAAKTCAAPFTSYEPQSIHKLAELMSVLQEALGLLMSKLGLAHARLGIRQKLTEQPSSYVVCTNFHDSLSIPLKGMHPEARLQGCDHFLETQKASKTPIELER